MFVAVRLRGDGELPRPDGDWAVELELDGLLLLSAARDRALVDAGCCRVTP